MGQCITLAFQQEKEQGADLRPGLLQIGLDSCKSARCKSARRISNIARAAVP